MPFQPQSSHRRHQNEWCGCVSLNLNYWTQKFEFYIFFLFLCAIKHNLPFDFSLNYWKCKNHSSLETDKSRYWVNLAWTNPCCKQLSIPQEDIKSTLNKIKSYMFPQYICLLLQLDARVFFFLIFWTKSHVFYFFSCLPWTSFLDGSDSKESACNAGDPGLIPWKRKWQPNPVLLPGEIHG